MGGFERGISGIIESNDRSVNCGTTTALLKQTFFIWLTQFLLILLQFAIKNKFQVAGLKKAYMLWLGFEPRPIGWNRGPLWNGHP